MDSQTKVYRAHRAFSWLYGTLSAGFLLLLVVLFVLSKGDDRAFEMAPGFLIFGALFAAHHFTARSCKQGKSGGRIASIVIAFFMLFGFPIGTIVGIYLLSNTWRPWNGTA